MAAAVAVDATIVRCVLVPAIMRLLGDAGVVVCRAGSTSITPQFSIEGKEWFAARDSAAAAAPLPAAD